MKNGLITTLIGAAVCLAAALFLPWQRFELADLTPTALALTPHAWALVIAVAGIGGTAAWALASRRRVVAARALLAACLLVAIGLVWAQGNRAWDLRLMAHEVVVMDVGFVLALVGLLVMFIGAATAVALAPTWDERSALVRLRAFEGGTSGASGDARAVREVVVYEPRRLALGDELGLPALAALPLEVTREAEVRIGRAGATRVAVDGRGGRRGRDEVWLVEGDRAVIEVADLELRVDYVRQPRQVASRLVVGGEVVGLALGALLVFLAAGVATVLATDEEAVRVLPDPERRVATIAALTQEERRADEVPMAMDAALVEAPTIAKAPGGDEGRFGDPEAAPERVTKVPPRSGAMIDRLDPMKLGLLEAVTDPRVDRAIADVLADDGAFAARLAAATAGTDDGWALGPGTSGLSIERDGDGGPGDGSGRLVGLGPIDTGPDRLPGTPTSLGPRDRRRVPKVEAPGPTIANDLCSRQAIDSVVRRRVGAIRGCYEQRLQGNPKLAGKLVTRWTIGADGRVSAADPVSDTLGDAATTQCVLRVVRNMRFPEPEGRGMCVVQYPFVFAAD